MDMKKPTLELTLDNGKTLSVEVAGYHLKFNEKLHVGANGKIHKIGTFKINSSTHKNWDHIKAIKYAMGECIVLNDTPKLTPRTVTYKIMQEF